MTDATERNISMRRVCTIGIGQSTQVAFDIDSFLFIDTATTEIYTLSLHDALPISSSGQLSIESTIASPSLSRSNVIKMSSLVFARDKDGDRKSTRLNSSHSQISYAVFCLKKKKSRLPAERATGPDD